MALHTITPLVLSTEFSAKFDVEVFLKLDAVQPCGSFKIRGIGHACETYYAEGASRFVSSSGGNAGYAVAYAGKQLCVPVTVVVPVTTSLHAQKLIASQGAEVVVFGDSWIEANEKAQTLLDERTVFIHPFDDPLLWKGHSTLVEELAAQGEKPDVIVCSVGGGGLLNGVIEGMMSVGWSDVGIVAAETMGAASLHQSLAEGRIVSLPEIATVATSLGAKTVSRRTYELASEFNVKTCALTDKAAVQGSVDLLNFHRILTEPACGVSVAALGEIKHLFPEAKRVVVIACGGIGTTIGQLQAWHADFA
ncbi:pyridoxal-phosphate dependent enzyme [Herbaspirillum huttiense]|uniref:pyridoxal-phosphate dependent enzyme n=1 Tax=Herbaspirillum huttiense TaxID=863372 RepID=UPI0031D81644